MAKEAKKILFTSHTANFQKFNRPFMRMLREQGHEVHYASMGEEKILDCDKEFVVPFTRSPFKLSNIQAYKQLKKIIDREEYDLIHTHTPMGSVVTRLAARAARKRGTRVIYTAHGFHFYKGAPLLNWLIYYPVEKWMAKHTDTLITINNEDFERARRKKFKTDVQYVPGVGVDPKHFEPRLTKKQRNEIRASLGLKPDDFVMIYPAELSKRKNQTALLKIFEEVLKQIPNAHLLLPGGDSMNGLHARLSKKMGIENNVHLLGYRGDIPQLLMASDLSVSTSLQEGLPVHIMEAMLAAIPIASHPGRGINELVIDNKSGILIEKNPQAAAGSIVELAKDLTALKSMGKRGLSLLMERGLINTDVNNLMREIYTYRDGEHVKSKQRLAIVTPGLLPVPATQGGAVETLCEDLTRENETQKKLAVTVFSTYNKDAAVKSRDYRHANFIFIKTPRIIQAIDLATYRIARFTLPTKNTAPLRFIFQRIHFTQSVSKYLSEVDYDHVLFENQIALLSSLRYHGNFRRYTGKYSLHTHNQMSRTYGNRKLALKANNIAVSEFIKKNLESKISPDKQGGRFKVVRNGIDQKAFELRLSDNEKIALKKDLGIKSNEKVILYIGRLTADKGIDKLVQSLEYIRQRKYKLLIVGSSFFGADVSNPFVDTLKKIAEPFKDHIVFTGYIEHSEVPSVFSIADVSVVPSIGVDAAPLTIIESLAAGLPIVTTDSGGIPEYVNKSCARILERDSQITKNLAASISEILGTEAVSTKMGQESLRLAKKLNTTNYYLDMLKAMGIK